MYSIFGFIFLGKTADYTDGETGYGLVGAIILFGSIYLISKIWPSNNDNHQDKDDYNLDDYKPVDDYELEEPDFIDIDSPSTDLEKELGLSPVITHTNNNVSQNVKEEVKNEDIISEEMKKECIRIYGDYGELVGIENGGISIKEDGEYRLIKGNDWRYKVLSSYIFNNRREMYFPANKISDHELIEFYSSCTEEEILPPAKSMEEHGQLSKEYLGGLIISLKAYIWKSSTIGYRWYSSRPISLNNFLFSIGFDKAVYLYKYVGKPMDLDTYRDFRFMQINGMTTNDFLAFKYGKNTLNSEGNFTQDGKSQTNVENNKLEKMPFTYEQAQREIMEKEWHL